MDNKDISPKVHKYTLLSSLEDDYLIMIVAPNGQKYGVTVKTLKEQLVGDLYKKIEAVRLA